MWKRSNGSAVLYFPHCIRVPHFVDKKGFLIYLLVCLGSGINLCYKVGFFHRLMKKNSSLLKLVL